MFWTSGEQGLSRERWARGYTRIRWNRSVHHQDASCEVNRLREVGPVFGDGSKPRRTPVTRRPRPPRRRPTGGRSLFLTQPSRVHPLGLTR
jgi:hypothetical protein